RAANFHSVGRPQCDTGCVHSLRINTKVIGTMVFPDQDRASRIVRDNAGKYLIGARAAQQHPAGGPLRNAGCIQTLHLDVPRAAPTVTPGVDRSARAVRSNSRPTLSGQCRRNGSAVELPLGERRSRENQTYEHQEPTRAIHGAAPNGWARGWTVAGVNTA